MVSPQSFAPKILKQFPSCRKVKTPRTRVGQKNQTNKMPTDPHHCHAQVTDPPLRETAFLSRQFSSYQTSAGHGPANMQAMPP